MRHNTPRPRAELYEIYTDMRHTKTSKHCSSRKNVRPMAKVHPGAAASSSLFSVHHCIAPFRPRGSRSRPPRRVGTATELGRSEADGGNRKRTRLGVRVGVLPLSGPVVIVARLLRESAVGSSRAASLWARADNSAAEGSRAGFRRLMDTESVSPEASSTMKNLVNRFTTRIGPM